MKRPAVFSPFSKQLKASLLVLVLIIAGCSLEKQSGFNRAMQNLTAHYNILFNANEILRLKQESYAETFVDNYNEILNVYPDTIAQSGKADKDLDAAILKANTLINFKEQSHYLGDAYLVLGKANYLGGNYFNAVEYFNYVIRSYPKRLDLMQQALFWKARALMYLDQLPQAKLSVDSAVQSTVDQKKKGFNADIFASKLQYDIDAQDYADGEKMAGLALKFCSDSKERLRWTFILAQLQELDKKPYDAIKNYSKIAKSNAQFEMAFNASLNRIRIEENENGIKVSRIDRLYALLKNPNNKEFKDQIYYQVAEIQMTGKETKAAIRSYNQSIRNSVKNQSQKGLAYLKLAEYNFNVKADYVVAKKYYDSTLTSLPVNYPGYQSIQKKASNLQLIADRLQIIAREDTLQSLAKMDEKTRLTIIDKMVNDKILQQQNSDNNTAANDATGTSTVLSGSGSTFYFYNAASISQGLTDFKKVWGNRKLEDNWRRSERSSSDITANNSFQLNPDVFATATQPDERNTASASNYRQELTKGLPLTPELLAQSNFRIFNAYVDIGNFYREILNDKKDAIATFELVLHRFPDNASIASVYYTLYRLYSDTDPAKADAYKNKLLKDYPNTAFAKVILDPDYAKKLDNANSEFTDAYNKIFDLYADKKYKDVITNVPLILKRYPGNKFSAQLYYLQTIAAGHNEKVGPFQDSLQQIVKKYPDDKLVTPLVKQHLAFINANLADMQNRNVVLADEDPKEIPFTLAQEFKENTANRKKVSPYIQPAVKTVSKPLDKKSDQAVAKPVPAPSGMFSMRDSTNYYFVVNVSTATTNLASSRFGIGQFNRANYTGKGIKHQLVYVAPDNQLIYVGRFLSLDEAKKYARQIIPLMPDIMKVPKDKYSFFIITQENLNKLADQKTLNSYIDYYQKNY